VTIPALPARYLDRNELTQLVEKLARRPEVWRDQVDYSGGQRHYASLHRDEYVDMWLICWSPGNDTGWHDHDISSGAVGVVQGVLSESNPRIGGVHAHRLIGEGSSFSFGPDHIHRLTGEADHTISLHAYSPPLWRLGQYTIDDSGVLRRVSVCYADELRPLDSVAAVSVAAGSAAAGSAAAGSAMAR
jgi:quercetin dioxygenase-like cupin family protein